MPVGTHETLLAYLVRRLLENGANTSFVRIGDESIPVETLVADPVEAASRIVPLGAPHEKIPLPRELYGSAAGRARQFRRPGPEQRTPPGLAVGRVAGQRRHPLARRSHAGRRRGRSGIRRAPSRCATLPTCATWSAMSSKPMARKPRPPRAPPPMPRPSGSRPWWPSARNACAAPRNCWKSRCRPCWA